MGQGAYSSSATAMSETSDVCEAESIAVIGFSFVFPEDATSEETFWSMLMEAKCASKPWPDDRLNGSALYHPDSDRYDSVRGSSISG